MKAIFYYTLAILVTVLSFLFSGLALIFALLGGTRTDNAGMVNGKNISLKMDDDDPVWI